MTDFEKFIDREEQIVPDGYQDSVTIGFSSHLVQNVKNAHRTHRIFRYEFRCNRFKNLSLNDYNDLGKALFALSEHYVENHYFTEIDKYFLYDFNIFKRDKIVLQFSVIGTPSRECADIQWEFIDVFLVALKIYCVDKKDWKPLSDDNYGHNLEYIIADFLESVEMGYAKIPNKRFDEYVANTYPNGFYFQEEYPLDEE